MTDLTPIPDCERHSGQNDDGKRAGRLIVAPLAGGGFVVTLSSLGQDGSGSPRAVGMPRSHMS